MERTRVLWLAKGLGPGGMERLLETHARVGDREHFEFEAAYLVERPHSIVPELEELGVVCHHLAASGFGWVRQLRRLLIDRSFDVVHVHSPMVAAVVRPLVRSMPDRPTLVYTEHNSWDCYGRATRLANAVTYRLDDVQIGVSAAAATAAPAALRPTMQALTHGVDGMRLHALADQRSDTRRVLGIADDAPIVLTVAHLRTEKAYDVLLDAAARVRATRSDVVFLSVGHGPLAAELERRRDELDLRSSFRFLGFRDDVAALMGAADVLCFSSRSEGLPVAFMEATTLGLPTVSTAVGGLIDAIDHEVNGLLVESGDVDGLAAALLRVLSDTDLRRRLGEASAAQADRFDARHAVAVIEARYLERVR